MCNRIIGMREKKLLTSYQMLYIEIKRCKMGVYIVFFECHQIKEEGIKHDNNSI